MEGFDEVINSYQATINTLMVQKARKDDIEMKKREELEYEMDEGFAKKLKITELIKSYMEWELDATLTDLQIIRQQQEFIKKIVAIVGEYNANEGKIDESNQMLKEADAAIESLKKEKSDKFHECARYKALLKDALKLIPKTQRDDFVKQKIKGIELSKAEKPDLLAEKSKIDIANSDLTNDEEFDDEQKGEDNFDDIKSDRICDGCGDDISDRPQNASYCFKCAKKSKEEKTNALKRKKRKEEKKGIDIPEGQPNVT